MDLRRRLAILDEVAPDDEVFDRSRVGPTRPEPALRARRGRRIVAGATASVIGAAAIGLAFIALSEDRMGAVPANGRIVIIAPDAAAVLQLFTTDGDGDADATQLTQAEGDVVQAEWAADGSAIAYVVAAGPELADVHVMRADGSDDRVACRECAQVESVQGGEGPARHVPSREATAIFVAPNGAFVRVAVSYGDILIHDSRDPDDPIVVERPLFGVDDHGFTWSRDGQQLAFSSKFPGAAGLKRQPQLDGIYVVDADGSDLRQVTHPPGPPYTFGPDSQPAWSPDGTQIAFTRYVAEFEPGSHLESPGRSDIWIADLESGEERQLTTAPLPVGTYGSTAPDWSPVGGEIAFLTDADGSPEDTGIGETDVSVIRADGTELRLLFSCMDDASYDRCPLAVDWSPDGRSLTYHGPSGTGPFVLTVEGSDPRLLTKLDDACCVRWQPTPA
jgi:dipeptidyl aminopeptidase/acylaminoacyl peptidase